jgi:hypothetical protein
VRIGALENCGVTLGSDLEHDLESCSSSHTFANVLAAQEIDSLFRSLISPTLAAMCD